jgi:hypothetical protein
MPPIKTAILRRDKEIEEFFEETYSNRWKTAKKISNYTVEIQDTRGQTWIILRDLNFHKNPPRIMKGDVEIQPSVEWQVGISAVEWFLLAMV